MGAQFGILVFLGSFGLGLRLWPHRQLILKKSREIHQKDTIKHGNCHQRGTRGFEAIRKAIREESLHLQVSESSFDYLTQEIVRYVLEESKTPSPLIVLEQVGFDIGYRLVERCFDTQLSRSQAISPVVQLSYSSVHRTDTQGTRRRSRRSRTGGRGLG
jgi:hypothetical protein